MINNVLFEITSLKCSSINTAHLRDLQRYISLQISHALQHPAGNLMYRHELSLLGDCLHFLKTSDEQQHSHASRRKLSSTPFSTATKDAISSTTSVPMISSPTVFLLVNENAPLDSPAASNTDNHHNVPVTATNATTTGNHNKETKNSNVKIFYEEIFNISSNLLISQELEESHEIGIGKSFNPVEPTEVKKDNHNSATTVVIIEREGDSSTDHENGNESSPSVFSGVADFFSNIFDKTMGVFRFMGRRKRGAIIQDDTTTDSYYSSYNNNGEEEPSRDYGPHSMINYDVPYFQQESNYRDRNVGRVHDHENSNDFYNRRGSSDFRRSSKRFTPFVSRDQRMRHEREHYFGTSDRENIMSSRHFMKMINSMSDLVRASCPARYRPSYLFMNQVGNEMRALVFPTNSQASGREIQKLKFLEKRVHRQLTVCAMRVDSHEEDMSSDGY